MTPTLTLTNPNPNHYQEAEQGLVRQPAEAHLVTVRVRVRIG